MSTISVGDIMTKLRASNPTTQQVVRELEFYRNNYARLHKLRRTKEVQDQITAHDTIIGEIQQLLRQMQNLEKHNATTMNVHSMMGSYQGARTLGELKQLIHSMEMLWTDEDTQMLGKLEDQPIVMELGDAQSGRGLAAGLVSYQAEFGLLIRLKDQ